jgi:flagellum-specific peptidoglycan hydrolase FlgJ
MWNENVEGMTASQLYIEQHVNEAMEQQRLYGIPASVTLAQALLESASGQSQLAKNENNHFGIKATDAWIKGGGRYALYSDDKPNEKFCSYDTVAESYTHHSQFLKNNSRYAKCFTLASDDYRGWANALAAAGYASDKHYAQSLISIIEKNGLNKYDTDTSVS